MELLEMGMNDIELTEVDLAESEVETSFDTEVFANTVRLRMKRLERDRDGGGDHDESAMNVRTRHHGVGRRRDGLYDGLPVRASHSRNVLCPNQ